MTKPRLALLLAAGLAAAALAGCSAGGGAALSSGLTQRMDAPGASLNRAEALGIVNHFRATSGSSQLTADASLDATAQSLAAAYAQSGTAPKSPAGAAGMRTSAGYPNFAETFSGWRNSPEDAAVLNERGASKAGIGVAYDPKSTYGVYWVLLLGN
ncbi:MAG TPA: CAP domain-containing protein [Devosia sp.]|jgi:uncharacterized protein YkwD